MTFPHFLILISALLVTIGAAAYIRDTWKGKTKPNRVSWFFWALLPLIGTAAALELNADIWATFRIFLAGFFPLVIFAVSFTNKRGYWHLTFFDWFCAFCALLAIAVWFFMNTPRMAILFAVIGDTFACLPTIYKAWKYPDTETGFTYGINLIGALLVIPSIPVWNIENSAFQIYLIGVNLILAVAVYRKKLLHSIYGLKP